jgi:hypothetical protein
MPTFPALAAATTRTLRVGTYVVSIDCSYPVPLAMVRVDPTIGKELNREKSLPAHLIFVRNFRRMRRRELE